MKTLNNEIKNMKGEMKTLNNEVKHMKGEMINIQLNYIHKREAADFSLRIAGPHAGVRKSRNYEARKDALVKVKHIPDAYALFLYHDLTEITMSKVMELSVFLWMQSTGYSPSWLSEEAKEFLQKTTNILGSGISEHSGLSLILFACPRHAKRVETFDSSAGQLSIDLAAHVLLEVFVRSRAELFRRPTKYGYEKPKWGRPATDPPNYLTSSFIENLGEGCEYEFIRAKVDELCKTPNTLFQLDKPHKRRRIESKSQDHVEVEPAFYEKTPSAQDQADVFHRIDVIRCLNRTMRDELTCGRKRIRDVLYKQFFFIIRTIQEQAAPASVNGFYVEWPENANDREGDREIPLAENPRTNDNAAEENTAAYEKMLADFPTMNCRGYYRRFVRPLSQNDRKYDFYVAELEKNDNKPLFVQEKIDINFHDLAMSAMATSLLETPASPVADVLALSPLSLRAVHIWAMGLRALCIEITGGPPVSDAEKAAANGVTPLSRVGPAQDGLSKLLLGVFHMSSPMASRSDMQKYRVPLDGSLMGCSFTDYLSTKAKRSVTAEHPHLGTQSPTDPANCVPENCTLPTTEDLPPFNSPAVNGTLFGMNIPPYDELPPRADPTEPPFADGSFVDVDDLPSFSQ